MNYIMVAGDAGDTSRSCYPEWQKYKDSSASEGAFDVPIKKYGSSIVITGKTALSFKWLGVIATKSMCADESIGGNYGPVLVWKTGSEPPSAAINMDNEPADKTITIEA